MDDNVGAFDRWDRRLEDARPRLDVFLRHSHRNSVRFLPFLILLLLLRRFIWAAILATGLVFLPESPRWLVAVGKDAEAQKSIARILGVAPESEAVAELYAEIAAAVHHTRSLGGTSYLDCFKNTNRNRLRTLTGIGLQAIQQLTGINCVYSFLFFFCLSSSSFLLTLFVLTFPPTSVIFYYGTTFFNNAGLTNSFVITIATQAVNVRFEFPVVSSKQATDFPPLLCNPFAL
jgi:SP family sugar:H+ symporter-like MFS transporter